MFLTFPFIDRAVTLTENRPTFGQGSKRAIFHHLSN
jgi:hypothetical protein